MRQTGVLYCSVTMTSSKPRSRNRRAAAAKLCDRCSATCSLLTFMCASPTPLILYIIIIMIIIMMPIIK
jgi:hypothetical protein